MKDVFVIMYLVGSAIFFGVEFGSILLNQKAGAPIMGLFFIGSLIAMIRVVGVYGFMLLLFHDKVVFSVTKEFYERNIRDGKITIDTTSPRSTKVSSPQD